MKSQETIQVVIEGSQGRLGSGTVEKRVFEKKERTVRAFKAWGAAWGLALVSILIPMLHFLLVPFFLISGPFIFYWILGQEQVILGGKGECPECKKEFKIVRSPVKWPITDLCNHCQAQVKVYPKN